MSEFRLVPGKNVRGLEVVGRVEAPAPAAKKAKSKRKGKGK